MSDTSKEHPLKGLVLGISASETVATSGHGLTSRELNRAIRQIATAVLGQGGRLAFGHDWRAQGVMADILEFAISHEPLAPATVRRDPMITNYLAGSEESGVSEEDRARYAKVLKIVKGKSAFSASLSGKNAQFDPVSVRAAALTSMRHDLAKGCDALMCFGGKTDGSVGRYAGVAEEAAVALRHARPLYVTALFGGAGAQIVKALNGAPATELTAFQPAPDVGAALARVDPIAKRAVDPSIFAQTGSEGLSALNALTPEENQRMFDARHLAEVIGLLLVGLARQKKKSRS